MQSDPRHTMAAVRGMALVALLLTFVSVPLYLYPPQDDVSDVDVVFVLGPHTASRIEKAEAISRANGDAPIYLSVAAERRGSRVCHAPHTTCVTPAPFSTIGEALLLTRLQQRERFTHVALVTVSPHAVRARHIFGQCYRGRFGLVSVPTSGSPADVAFQISYQTAAFVKALTSPCAESRPT